MKTSKSAMGLAPKRERGDKGKQGIDGRGEERRLVLPLPLPSCLE
jgi:hypothetical protein